MADTPVVNPATARIVPRLGRQARCTYAIRQAEAGDCVSGCPFTCASPWRSTMSFGQRLLTTLFPSLPRPYIRRRTCSNGHALVREADVSRHAEPGSLRRFRIRRYAPMALDRRSFLHSTAGVALGLAVPVGWAQRAPATPGLRIRLIRNATCVIHNRRQDHPARSVPQRRRRAAGVQQHAESAAESAGAASRSCRADPDRRRCDAAHARARRPLGHGCAGTAAEKRDDVHPASQPGSPVRRRIYSRSSDRPDVVVGGHLHRAHRRTPRERRRRPANGRGIRLRAETAGLTDRLHRRRHHLVSRSRRRHSRPCAEHHRRERRRGAVSRLVARSSWAPTTW